MNTSKRDSSWHPTHSTIIMCVWEMYGFWEAHLKMKTVLKWSQVRCGSWCMCSVIGFHFKWFTVVQRLKCIIIMYSVLAYNDNVCSMFLLISSSPSPSLTHSLIHSLYSCFFFSIHLSFSSLMVVCAYFYCSDDIIWTIFSPFSHISTHCWCLIYHPFVGGGYLHYGVVSQQRIKCDTLVQ